MKGYELVDEEDKAKGRVLQQLMNLMDDRIGKTTVAPAKDGSDVAAAGGEDTEDDKSPAEMLNDVRQPEVQGITTGNRAPGKPSGPIDEVSVDSDTNVDEIHDDLSMDSSMDEDLKKLIRSKRG